MNEYFLEKQSRESYLIVVVDFIIFLFEILLHRREARSIELSKNSEDSSEAIFIEWTEIFEIECFSLFEELFDMSDDRRWFEFANIRDRINVHSLLEKSIGLFMGSKLRRFFGFQ